MEEIFYKKAAPEWLTFPVDQLQVNKLSKGSNLVSPISMDNDLVHLAADEIKFKPYSRHSEKFWNQLVGVVEAVKQTRTNKWSSDIDVPYMRQSPVSKCVREVFGVRTPSDGAELVHADWPDIIVNYLAEYLLKNGATFRNITNEGNYKNFTNGIVLLSRVLGWAVHHVSPTAFAHKYHYGIPRPEEMIGMWVRGEIDAPTKEIEYKLTRLIDSSWRSEIIKDQRDFTKYKGKTYGSHGSPNHMSFPAMHSAAAAAQILIPVFMNLSKFQLSEVRHTSVNIAFFRTYAGVHYEMDNYYGLELGERVIEKILPEYLAKFGANPRVVQNLVKKHRIDWTTHIR